YRPVLRSRLCLPRLTKRAVLSARRHRILDSAAMPCQTKNPRLLPPSCISARVTAYKSLRTPKPSPHSTSATHTAVLAEPPRPPWAAPRSNIHHATRDKGVLKIPSPRTVQSARRRQTRPWRQYQTSSNP